MKKVTIVLVVACVWMGVSQAQRSMLGIENWMPDSLYEQSVKAGLKTIEKNYYVQKVDETGLANLQSLDSGVLREAHRQYEQGVTLLTTALKKKWKGLGSSKIKGAFNRASLKLLLEFYTDTDKIIVDAIALKLTAEQLKAEQLKAMKDRLLVAMLLAKKNKEEAVFKQQVVQTQELENLDELDNLVSELKRSRYIAKETKGDKLRALLDELEELDDEAFIEESQKWIFPVDYPALMKELTSAMQAAQQLRNKLKDQKDRDEADTQLKFLYNWYKALESSQVAPNNRIIPEIVVTPPDNNDEGFSESGRIIDEKLLYTESYA